jgi:hypothetical protein
MLKFKSRLTAAAVLALTCLANGPAWAATSVTYVSGKAQMPALARHLQILAGRSNLPTPLPVTCLPRQPNRPRPLTLRKNSLRRRTISTTCANSSR